jgi:Icc-related predicted phosphoesterase
LRILAITDIHGAYEKMESIVRREAASDMIVVGGDLTTFGTPDEAREAIERLQSFRKPVFVVGGNMDPLPLEDVFINLGVSINGRGVVTNGIGLFGVSGAPTSPLNTPHEIAEETIRLRAEHGWKEVREARVTIFVPHAPPYNTSLDRTYAGNNVGSRAVREFIEDHHPDLTICGHIHEAWGQDRIGTTVIVNCGQVGKGRYAIVDIDDGVHVQNMES